MTFRIDHASIDLVQRQVTAALLLSETRAALIECMKPCDRRNRLLVELGRLIEALTPCDGTRAELVFRRKPRDKLGHA